MNEKDIREIEEAIAAGRLADKSLSRLINKLNSARNWGIWDILGGKFLVNMAKHSAINKANQISYEVQNNLRRFSKELNDISDFSDLQVNLSSFTTFADFFFDGIFVDFFVQSKIKDAIRNTRDVQNTVNDILYKLERELTRLRR